MTWKEVNGMIAVMVILAVLLLAQTCYLLYYRHQIKDIGNQLDFTFRHQSLKFLHTQIKPREINRLVQMCNELLESRRASEQRAIQRNSEINTTIVSLSHDIRTPLTSLDGYLQLADRSSEPEEKAGYVRLAQSRIRQIITLVDELFLYTKLQNPEYRFELEPIDAVGMLQKSLFSFFDEFTRHGREPELELPEEPVPMMANSNALERIFQNVIKNYFVHGYQSLIVRYEKTQDGFRLYFTNSVRPGSTVDMDRVFKRFYKEDPSRTVQSTGLGLSIVKSLAEKMNGTARAELEGEQFSIIIEFKSDGRG